MKHIILTDACDDRPTDLITLDEEVPRENVVAVVEQVKKELPGEYSNLDIIEALAMAFGIEDTESLGGSEAGAFGSLTIYY